MGNQYPSRPPRPSYQFRRQPRPLRAPRPSHPSHPPRSHHPRPHQKLTENRRKTSTGVRIVKRYDYKEVKRWTKGINIFLLKRMYCPINIGNTHWALAVIDFKKMQIQYYDSLDNMGVETLDNLLRYLEDEAKSRGYAENVFLKKNWELIENTIETPRQVNGDDCGVCTMINLSFLVFNKPLNYGTRARKMEVYRRRILRYILNYLTE